MIATLQQTAGHDSFLRPVAHRCPPLLSLVVRLATLPLLRDKSDIPGNHVSVPSVLRRVSLFVKSERAVDLPFLVPDLYNRRTPDPEGAPVVVGARLFGRPWRPSLLTRADSKAPDEGPIKRQADLRRL